MESDSSFNTTINESALVLVPIGAVAFAPFLLLELVAAIVSNALLLALVILACVKKLNNNINIYLFSLAIGGLMGAFEIFCLTSLVVARRWVLGADLCSMNFFNMIAYNAIFTFIYLLISLEKLKGVKDPLRGRSTNIKAYVSSVIVWAVAITIAISFLIWGRNKIGTNNGSKTARDEYGDFVCYGLTSRRTNMSTRFITISIFLFSVWTIQFILTTVVFANFMRILWEVKKLRNLRLQFPIANDIENSEGKVININGHDKPLYCTGEERTAKSLTLVFIIQFFCFIICYVMIVVQIIRNFILPPEIEDGANFQIYFIVHLMVQFFPSVGPVFLVLSNKRFRTRVKELFKCTFDPETESSPVHQPVKNPSTVILAHKTNKIHVAPFSASEGQCKRLRSS